MENREWSNDDIFTVKGNRQINIFLYHPYIIGGLGNKENYINSCLDLFASVALLQMTVLSGANILIYDKYNDKNWKQEWPKFPENDYSSCNLLLGNLYTENGMDPGDGRVFGTSGMEYFSLFCRLFHEKNLGTLLLLRFHEKLWCRIESYRKITKALGIGIWQSILYHYKKESESTYGKFYYGGFPTFREHHIPFSYQKVNIPYIGLTKELCLLDIYGDIIDHTQNLRSFIGNLI